jgi:transposase
MGSKLTAAEREARRRLAVQRVGEGWSQKDVAAFLGVHPVTVNTWVRAHRAGGDEALKGKPHPGRAPALTADQQRQVLGWLAEKPTAHGFNTDLWIAGRVAHRIRERFGVAYHPGYVREWLAKRGYSPQKPARRAPERDQAAIDRWLAEDWPRLKKKRRARGRTSS